MLLNTIITDTKEICLGLERCVETANDLILATQQDLTDRFKRMGENANRGFRDKGEGVRVKGKRNLRCVGGNAKGGNRNQRDV